MRLHVKKWGNSAAVRIPASIIAAASMHIDQAVDVKEEAGRIIIEPVAAPSFKLETLLDQIKRHVAERYYGLNPLHPTGPVLFGQIVAHHFEAETMRCGDVASINRSASATDGARLSEAMATALPITPYI